mmetsp:Transcript_71482/g.188608  ORF Transcript_71482/g.188608 Transcript_71482/m.188608 type:complete len:231 (-) Transcript_71482:216-908(-)
MQLITTRYVPPIYWLVIISSSLAGTCLSDMMDRNIFAQEKAGYAVGYAKGMSLLLGILLALFITWRCSGRSLSVTGPMPRLAEFFYWACIIVSNTLGTAVGDFTSDNLELGSAGGACLYGGLMLLTAILAVCTPISRVGLFWVWFVLTRPFGATFGDLLTKKKKAGRSPGRHRSHIDDLRPAADRGRDLHRLRRVVLDPLAFRSARLGQAVAEVWRQTVVHVQPQAGRRR